MTELEVLQDCLDVIGLEIVASALKHGLSSEIVSGDDFVKWAAENESERMRKAHEICQQMAEIEARKLFAFFDAKER